MLGTTNNQPPSPPPEKTSSISTPELERMVDEMDHIVTGMEHESTTERIMLSADEAIGIPTYEGPLQRFSAVWYSFTFNRIFALAVLDMSMSMKSLFIFTGANTMMEMLKTSIASHVNKEDIYKFMSYAIVLMILLLCIFTVVFSEHIDAVMPGRKVFTRPIKIKTD